MLANRAAAPEPRPGASAVGEAVRQALIHNEGIAPERVEVIYNGIPLRAVPGPARPSRNGPPSAPRSGSGRTTWC